LPEAVLSKSRVHGSVNARGMLRSLGGRNFYHHYTIMAARISRILAGAIAAGFLNRMPALLIHYPRAVQMRQD
jgi:hypothetical protein